MSDTPFSAETLRNTDSIPDLITPHILDDFRSMDPNIAEIAARTDLELRKITTVQGSSLQLEKKSQ